MREKTRDGIGLYAEKRLHSVLKRWVYDDLSAHEQKVVGRGEKKRRFVADVLTPDGDIFEIQTGKLYPMRQKIDFYLTETDHPVTVLHPLAAEKHICWIDPKSGELVRRNKVTRPEHLLCGVAELLPFLPYLEDPRFAVVFPLLAVDEYRLLDGWGNGGKRGSHRYELMPLSLLDLVTVNTPQDILALFPAECPGEFVAKEFSRLVRLSGYALYDMLAIFQALGAISPDGKKGRATLWRRLL